MYLYTPRTCVCQHVLHYSHCYTTLGVVILKNKLNGLPFNKAEEETFRVFATFCGLGVQNVVNYEEILKANAKQTVALEVSMCT